MICGKCHLTILPGEAYTEHDKLSTSAGGITIRLHVVCPPKSGPYARR